MHSKVLFNIMFAYNLFSLLIIESEEVNLSDYWKIREELIKRENLTSLGGNLLLNEKETLANKLLMDIKSCEYEIGVKNESNFLPQGHFFHTKVQMEHSGVFNIIKKIPKGGSLHTHLMASVSFDYIFYNLTYEKNLYGCILNNNNLKLKFFEHEKQSDQCRWELIENLRKKNDSYNDWLKEQLTLVVKDPREFYKNNIDMVWTKFSKIFSTSYDLISYKPIFVKYIYQVLFESHMDNIFYVEFRGVPLKLYELNGSVYDVDQFFQIFIETIEKFKKDYPTFFSAKFIYSPYRKINATAASKYIEEFIHLNNKYPQFVIGFDLVGFEEKGKSLKDFVPLLLNINKNVKYFFHAGETNWSGLDVDLNILDAVLLNSTRIGHAYAIVKHPEIMKLILNQDIAIEICPISNQILMLVDDFRNHPANLLIADGYPVVVCNDDPTYFGSIGLTYDWYLVFMGMANKNTDLRLLKQLAVNSIKYSAMTIEEKKIAFDMWNASWNDFIDEITESKSTMCFKNINLLHLTSLCIQAYCYKLRNELL